MAGVSLPAGCETCPMTAMRVRRNTAWSRGAAAGLLLGGAVALAGCESISDEPLDPVASEAGWQARTLESPELADFLCRHGCLDATGARPRFDLHALTLAAVWSHPDVRVAAAQLAEARAAIVTAGAVPNPSLSMEAEKDPNVPGH